MTGKRGAAVGFRPFHHRKLYSAGPLLGTQVVQPTEHWGVTPLPALPRVLWGASSSHRC